MSSHPIERHDSINAFPPPAPGRAGKRPTRALPSLATVEDERTKWNVSELATILRRARCGAKLRDTILALYERLPQGAEELPRGFRDLENDLGLEHGTLKNRSREHKKISDRIGRDLWTTLGGSKTGDGTHEDDYHDSRQSLRGLFAVRQEVSELALEEAQKRGQLFDGATWETGKWALDLDTRRAVWSTAVYAVCPWDRQQPTEERTKGKATLDDRVAMAIGLIGGIEREAEDSETSPVPFLCMIRRAAEEAIRNHGGDDGPPDTSAGRWSSAHTNDQENPEMPINSIGVGVEITPPPPPCDRDERPSRCRKSPPPNGRRGGCFYTTTR